MTKLNYDQITISPALILAIYLYTSRVSTFHAVLPTLVKLIGARRLICVSQIHPIISSALLREIGSYPPTLRITTTFLSITYSRR